MINLLYIIGNSAVGGVKLVVYLAPLVILKSCKYIVDVLAVVGVPPSLLKLAVKSAVVATTTVLVITCCPFKNTLKLVPNLVTAM
jgi:hypothetical protein